MRFVRFFTFSLLPTEGFHPNHSLLRKLSLDICLSCSQATPSQHLSAVDIQMATYPAIVSEIVCPDCSPSTNFVSSQPFHDLHSLATFRVCAEAEMSGQSVYLPWKDPRFPVSNFRMHVTLAFFTFMNMSAAEP